MSTDLTVRAATAREKLNGKENYKTQLVRMKSDLIGQALQRYTDSGLLRARPLRQEAVLLTTTIAAVVVETDNAYKDRVDKYNTKVYKSRTYILDNCDPQIADYCAEAYDTATALQDYLLDQFGKASIS